MDLEEQFYQGRFDWKSMSSNDAAALMKQFLRDLPNPLLTHEYRESFAQVQCKILINILFSMAIIVIFIIFFKVKSY